MKTVENKKLVLRVISVLSDNTENKLEIGIDSCLTFFGLLYVKVDWKGLAK
jgi:hypothetical protein